MKSDQNKNKVLVAYFSYSGNTKKIAQQIQEQTKGDIYEIKKVTEYPLNYNDVLAQAKQEIKSGAKPILHEKIGNMDNYELVFLGFPNWWNTFPAPVLTFLSENNFAGKTIMPFCTHGGGGIGHSISEIAKQCPRSKISKELSINGYATKANNSEVIKWINNINK